MASDPGQVFRENIQKLREKSWSNNAEPPVVILKFTELDDLCRAVDAEFDRLRTENNLLAMLAADDPQFYNPTVVREAKEIRDRILAQEPPHADAEPG